MMQLLKDAWAGLSPTGRIVLIVCVTAVVIVALFTDMQQVVTVLLGGL